MMDSFFGAWAWGAGMVALGALLASGAPVWQTSLLGLLLGFFGPSRREYYR